MSSTRTSYMTTRGEPPEPGDPLLDFKPVPHKQLRRNSIGPERQRAFIAHLAATGIVKQAARHIGASLEALYKLRHKNGADEFAAAWDAAVDRGVQRLEDCALQRAIVGEERLVVSAGKVLGSEVRHNENLVMFFLRHRRPDRYGFAREQELKPGHPVYERIKQEVLDEEYGDEAEVFESIDKFIDGMRQRRLKNDEILEDMNKDAETDEGGDYDGEPPQREAEAEV